MHVPIPLKHMPGGKEAVLPLNGNNLQYPCRAVGFWHDSKSERYIEDTDRFPGWKGELPVPIQDYRNESAAPTALTIGVGADGKVFYLVSVGYLVTRRSVQGSWTKQVKRQLMGPTFLGRAPVHGRWVAWPLPYHNPLVITGLLYPVAC